MRTAASSALGPRDAKPSRTGSMITAKPRPGARNTGNRRRRVDASGESSAWIAWADILPPPGRIAAKWSRICRRRAKTLAPKPTIQSCKPLMKMPPKRFKMSRSRRSATAGHCKPAVRIAVRSAAALAISWRDSRVGPPDDRTAHGACHLGLRDCPRRSERHWGDR